MDDVEKCLTCNKDITGDMVYCPGCGNPIIRSENRHKYDYDEIKKLEHLEEIDMVLCHLEEELDAILCKKR